MSSLTINQKYSLSKSDRQRLNGHNSFVVWLTGLSGSGKSTIANELEIKLNKEGFRTMVLDGDNIRKGLNNNLGFSDNDREENVRRIAEVCKLFVEAGVIVITAFISPFKKERDFARSLVDTGEFLEVFVDCPLSECEKRDVKGLYARARNGEIKDFTGIDSVYEKPSMPEVYVNTSIENTQECVQKIFNLAKKKAEDINT